jgi:serine/threonine protein kinase
LSSNDPPEIIGRRVSHYEVLDEISRGGMGIVYRARDVKLDRDVALKVLPLEWVSRLEREKALRSRSQGGCRHEPSPHRDGP